MRASALDAPSGAAPQASAGAVTDSKTAGAPSPADNAKDGGPPRDGKGAPIGGCVADIPMPLLSGWACDHHGTGRHSVFGSYRVASEGAAGNGLIEKLVDAIESAGPLNVAAVGPEPAPAVSPTVFYDRRCLNDGESWEAGLKNGLEGASLVMPLVSAGALRGMIEHAATRRDNLLMEWEIALERQSQGLCLLLPIFIESVGADGKPLPVDFRVASYPDSPHFMSGKSIRATLAALFLINGIKVSLGSSGALDPAQLEALVGRVRQVLDSQVVRMVRHRAQQAYDDERGRRDQMWKRVEAILVANDVIGRGASSVVFRGKLHPTEPDDPPVAVKALKAGAVAASKQFTTELEIMKALKVSQARSTFCFLLLYGLIACPPAIITCINIINKPCVNWSPDLPLCL